MNNTTHCFIKTILCGTLLFGAGLPALAAPPPRGGDPGGNSGRGAPPPQRQAPSRPAPAPQHAAVQPARYAPPRHAPPPRPSHHHHGGPRYYNSGNVWAYAGGAFLAGAIINAATRPSTVVYSTTTPVVYATTAAPVVNGYWQEQVQNVWVEPCWVDGTDVYGRPTRIWREGHYEARTTQVWVSTY